MRIATFALSTALTSYMMIAQPACAETAEDPDAKAAATEQAMTDEERTTLTHGIMPLPFFPVEIPADAIPGAGYIAGIERLGIPALKETDASLGVSYIGGMRKDGATALPSGMVMGSTWNPELMRQGGAMIAGEAHAKGFNVLLAGGINLVRDPRNGRTFEYLGEDPLHSGLLGGASIAGIQSQHVISTAKHFALNGQETGRHFVDMKISDAAARESDLLAFQIAIEIGQPGAIMCAYNKVNGDRSCGNGYLMNQILKQEWGYKGWVMSDWGAVPGIEAALAGLDQQSGEQLDKGVYFADKLRAKADADPAYAARLSDMNRRILRSIYAVGIDKNPPVIKPIDFEENAKVAQQVAEEGIVLLHNRGDILPLAKTAKSIAVIGGYANSGVLSGGGSSQTQGEGGPAVAVPLGGGGMEAMFFSKAYHRSVPLKAIKAKVPDADVVYRYGDYITDAVIAAKKAEVAIVFATQWQTEGLDVPDLNLPNGQDALIAAVAAANPNTIVVLETGGPVLMPWLDKTAAVIEAWYPGARGAEAIASIIFGDINPSGKLPVTFPANLDQLPRPKLDGSDTVEPNFQGVGKPGQTLEVDYNIEGSDIGYRWFARKGQKALFPFGFGLSYTSFDHSGLKLKAGDDIVASFKVRNSGKRTGADVAQLYMVSANGTKKQRLVGFKKVQLEAGKSQKVSVTIDPRLIADWKNGGWHIAAGTYKFALGKSAEDLGSPTAVKLDAKTWGPSAK